MNLGGDTNISSIATKKLVKMPLFHFKIKASQGSLRTRSFLKLQRQMNEVRLS